MAVLETLRFRLWDGELVDQFLRSNAQVEREYLSTRPGFDRGWRTTSLADDGTWTITTRWASGVDAEGAMAGLAKAPGAAAFLACIGDPITVHREVEVPSPTSRKVDHAHRLYLEGIRDGDARRAVHAYTGDRYTQHSTGVRDGAEGFLAFFEPFLERNPKRRSPSTARSRTAATCSSTSPRTSTTARASG